MTQIGAEFVTQTRDPPVTAAAESIVPLALRAAAERVLRAARVVITDRITIPPSHSRPPLLGHYHSPGPVQEEQHSAPDLPAGFQAAVAGAVSHRQRSHLRTVDRAGN